ncbi:MAG: glycosyltransferase [Mucilaginibacter sp.]
MHKVLFIVTKGQTGGAQKFVYEQIKVLADSLECYLSTNSEGWLSEKTASYIKKSLLDPRIESISLKYLIKLYRFIKDNKIDLVVCSSANGGLYGRLASFFSGRKSVYVSHGWSSVYNGGRFAFILNFFETLLSLISTSILCISHNDYLIAREKIKVPNRKLRVITNAIIPIKEIDAKKKFDIACYKVLTVARLASPKRIDLLMEAVKDLENVELTVIGDGPDGAALKQLANEQKILNVNFKGEVKSFRDFEDYDIFALISESEGLPMSAIEAMSFGMPLVLSDVGGCPELIRNSGTLVENEGQKIKKGIAECILKLGEFSNNSYNYYRQEFNLLKKKAVFLDYYDSIISSNKIS